MTHESALLRRPRRSVLAFVALAALFATARADAPPPGVPAVPVLPGQPALTTAAYVQPALQTGGPGGIAGLIGVLLDSSERPKPLLDGHDGAGFQRPGTGSIPARPARAGARTAADPAVFERFALSRAGRDSAPPTAPPSFPS